MRAMRPSRVRPALFTSRSSSPASSTRRRAASGSDTSAWIARPPASRAAASASSPPERYPSTTDAPARASSSAIARPIPRDAPVTSAVLPSSEQNAGASSSSEGLLELLDRGEAVHGDRLHAAVDPLHEAREDVARPDLDEGAHALARELARRLRELDRRRELVDEQGPEPLRRLDLRRHRRHEGRDRLGEADALDRRPQAVGRAGDERAVEGAGNLELHRPARPLLPRLRAAPVHRRVGPRDHDLPGAAVVRRPHPEDPAAELLDDLVLEAEDRGHRAGVLPRRLGHREPALAHERDRLRRADRTGGGNTRLLAD